MIEWLVVDVAASTIPKELTWEQFKDHDIQKDVVSRALLKISLKTNKSGRGFTMSQIKEITNIETSNTYTYLEPMAAAE